MAYYFDCKINANISKSTINIRILVHIVVLIKQQAKIITVYENKRIKRAMESQRRHRPADI